MKIVVKPADDGFDMRGNWVVDWPKGTSPHTKKSAAKRKARQVASAGDTLEIRRTDGSIQNSVTVRSASASSSSSSSSGSGSAPYGAGAADIGLGDAFDP